MFYLGVVGFLQSYLLGLTQVIARDMLMEANFEAITDEGFLNNPYRSVRYLDPNSALGYSYEPEVYPNTRTSNALALRSLYYLPYRASALAEYRIFDDTWGIRAHNVKLAYIHPLSSGWLFEAATAITHKTRRIFTVTCFLAGIPRIFWRVTRS